MSLLKDLIKTDLATLGQELHCFAADLYPICRSITGDGIRETLRRIKTRIPLETFEVPTGAQVFDWTVPQEWKIRDAYIAQAGGKRIVDFRKCNLHVMSYSVPMHETMPLSKLKPHLLTIPERPDWIP